MKKLTKAILGLSLAIAAGCVSVPKVDNAPIAALNLNRYLGEWYEIARFDHSFERGVEQAKANYTQNADGTIKVVNSGIKDSKPKTAIGKGKTTDTPGLLRVSFFGPFYADYRVMLIDKDYSHALVGSGSADYLWILSRTSDLPETAKAELLAEARRRGYDTGKLIWVRQGKDSTTGSGVK
jgi:lipocalin